MVSFKMICKYCETIHSVERSYSLRRATKDVHSDYPRCNWHWRYICSICGRPRHFNGITWCEKTGRFVCIRCAKGHKAVPHKFWSSKYYYALQCGFCGKYHPALDYLEYAGKHPWQLHRQMEGKRQGLDPATKLRQIPDEYVPLTEAATEAQISQAWSRFAHEWADRYTEYGDLNRQYIIDPVIFRLLGSVKGSRVLDAGCGNGYLSRLLTKKGAKVVGIDISKEFIRMARQKEKELPVGIAYYEGTIRDMNMCENETFDIVVSNLALMDLADLDKAVKEFHRVLKKDGKLVFSIMHPCFAGPPVHGWLRTPSDTDRNEDRIYWKVDRYFDKAMEVWRMSEDGPPLYSFHRTLSDYIKALFRHKFRITDFEEPTPSRKAIEKHYRDFGDDSDRIPWFLIIGARKEHR